MEILDVAEYIGISPILLFVMTAVSTAGLGVLFIALFMNNSSRESALMARLAQLHSENQKLKNEDVVRRREVEELSRGGVKVRVKTSKTKHVFGSHVCQSHVF